MGAVPEKGMGAPASHAKAGKAFLSKLPPGNRKFIPAVAVNAKVFTPSAQISNGGQKSPRGG